MKLPAIVQWQDESSGGVMHPLLLRCGPVTVSSFFALGLLAFLAAAWMAARRADAAGLTARQTVALGAATLLAMTVGARVGYLVLYAGYYRLHPEGVLHLSTGGFTLIGGLLGVLGVSSFLLRVYRKPFFATIDRMIPPLVLGQMIARIGCFLQGCCYGRRTSLPWGVVYPTETNVHRHPTQLLEAAALFLLLFFLLRIERSRRWAGTNFLWYGLLYSSTRFAVDFLRADSAPLAAGLKLSQWIALPLAVLFGLFLVRRVRRCTPSS